MRILFVSANRVGDAVVTCGVLDHLIQTYPDSRITVTCGPAAAGLFARMPNLEEIIVVEKRPGDVHWLILWSKVVVTRWDLVVDTKGSGLGYLVWSRRRAVRKPIGGRMHAQHAALMGLDPPPQPVVWTAQEDRDKAAALLPSGQSVIAMGPTANWDGKVWPADRFARLYRLVAEMLVPGAALVVLGGPGPREHALAAGLLDAVPEGIDLCGKLTLPEASAVMLRSNLYVGNDSGLMHMAAAAGIPTVGLFGSTIDRADEMAPTGPRAVAVLSECPNMQAISVQKAYDACVDALGRPAASPADLIS